MASAATAMTPAQIGLIESLSQDDIPIKLRCAICSKLAVNAFRLPCCEQAICENCQQNLPTTCPVCEHSPLSAEDCLAHKGLRTTIKVFLRTEEKKKAAAEARAAKETPIDTSVSVLHPSAVEEPKEDNTQVGEGDAPSKDAEAITIAGVNGEEPKPEDNVAGAQSPEDVPQQSIEEIAPGQESTIGVENIDEEDKGATPEVTTNGAATITGMPNIGMMGGPSLGSGAMGDISSMSQMQQMQMMMAMQSGMPFGGVGFPMMGMPGMNMDPMMMQQMMSGPIMGGMNGMSGMGNNMGGMGMGMNGMNGGYGRDLALDDV